MTKSSTSRRRKAILVPILLLVVAALMFVPSLMRPDTLSLAQEPAVTVHAVTLDVLQPANPEHQVELSKAALEAINKALDRFARDIENASLGLYSRRVDPVLTETRTAELVKFSLILALNNGSKLSSKRRWVPKEALVQSVSESVERCMARYHSAAGEDHKRLFMSNI